MADMARRVDTFCFLPGCKKRIMQGSSRPRHGGALHIPAIRTEAPKGEEVNYEQGGTEEFCEAG